MPKQFDLSDVLSVTTPFLLSSRGMEGMYDILSYMTGESLMTHQLPRAHDVCSPALLAQHPALVGVAPPSEERDVWRTIEDVAARKAYAERWIAEQRQKYGSALLVEPLAAGVYELLEMVPAEKVIVVVPPR